MAQELRIFVNIINPILCFMSFIYIFFNRIMCSQVNILAICNSSQLLDPLLNVDGCAGQYEFIIFWVIKSLVCR